jgi:two-component system CheB/CheR fusion protein
MAKTDASPEKRPAEVDRLLSTLLAQAHDHAVLVFGLDERILWANHGAETLLGATRKDLVGLHASELFLDEDVERGLHEHELEVARSKGSAHDDRWSRRPDGSRFWATGLAYALRDPRGELLGYGKIIQNRTDWKQRQETLVNQVQAANRAVEYRDSMISTLAHELRSPLTPLLNAAQMLRHGMPVDYPVQLIERQVEFIRRQVDDLLEAARARSGKLRLKRERLVLQDVISASVEMAKPRLEKRSQRLEILLAPAPIVVDGDAVRLQQVLANLLNNAGKYTAEGGCVWVKATIEDEDAVVRIEDNGVGIAPDMLQFIFELFAQVPRADQESDAEGLGIGLSLVKELVALHGGTVQANSDGIGKGSVFTVRLPLSGTPSNPPLQTAA